MWMALGCSTRHCKGMDFGAFYAVELMSLTLGQFISLAWHTLLWKVRFNTNRVKMNPNFLLKKHQ